MSSHLNRRSNRRSLNLNVRELIGLNINGTEQRGNILTQRERRALPARLRGSARMSHKMFSALVDSPTHGLSLAWAATFRTNRRHDNGKLGTWYSIDQFHKVLISNPHIYAPPTSTCSGRYQADRTSQTRINEELDINQRGPRVQV